ncbi:glycerol-3-phosphate dehydrogenase/oxidase [Niabella drilacis]|uniref:Glycerol-3-phosphate dehydrogenase n=1 Tax=Niabella drilacis (strain DSM 25811 / CCM 8410 / CCUG 62505 / LMG 26954 / E90) TaxID=1285928 RepID=A0A1G6XBW3_NIADE|nr:glycerol-3-phosphate dehydrogenase/oxidase [Niabella drilacis]SDD75694.1 glycerol-3-phosphate dehydrogenase [Niabella drilacis]
MRSGIIDREQLVKKATEAGTLWDVLVIGGGASGLGIALEAVTRGYKTLLLEQYDFAKGTSSRSTKLVHGGVRYLAQGDIALVREASIERGLLQQNAPHLVKNQTFIVPVYSFWDRIKYTIGLKAYDWIAGRLSLGASVFISRKETMAAIPDVKSKGLVGGVLYHDGQFDDSRLALNLAQTIIEQGGVAVNYMKVTGLEKDPGNKPSGVEVEDTELSISYKIKAKTVINATGVFVDDVLRMDDPVASKSVVASQGIHLVLNREFFSSSHALMIPKTNDGRVLFAVPWHNEVVVGTTDTLVGAPSVEPRPLEKEIEFILETAGTYLVKKPVRADVLSVFAGLRPLAAPKEGAQKTKEISRSHKIMVSANGLFTIIGGKWTTYRKMGEDMIDCVENRQGWAKRDSKTPHLKIHGFARGTDWADPLYFYGSDAQHIKARGNGRWISERLKINEAQVEWAVTHEMARTVEDVLARRTRALLLDARESIRIASKVATVMAGILNRDEHWIKEETKRFEELARQYILT